MGCKRARLFGARHELFGRRKGTDSINFTSPFLVVQGENIKVRGEEENATPVSYVPPLTRH